MCSVEVRPAIGTDRLVLRHPVAADAAAIAELANDLAVAGATARMPYPYRQADAEWFVARCARLAPRTQAEFAIEHRSFGLIGMIGFDEKEPRRTEIGYWLGRPFWGRGYATEATKAALGWARTGWGKNVVWAGHFADNPASGAVLCKAGFLYTGEVVGTPCVARGGQSLATRMMVWLA